MYRVHVLGTNVLITAGNFRVLISLEQHKGNTYIRLDNKTHPFESSNKLCIVLNIPQEEFRSGSYLLGARSLRAWHTF